MDRVILFIALSLPLIYVSKRSLFDIKSHGFTRFFSWECILLLIMANYKVWFVDPFSLKQVISWMLLIISLFMVVSGTLLLKAAGKPSGTREDDDLFHFEKTTELVTSGIFRYIRHPLYSSLFFLTWGIYIKQPTVIMTLVALLSSLLLYVTAIRDEKECITYFGDSYSEYMKGTKRFVPFIF